MYDRRSVAFVLLLGVLGVSIVAATKLQDVTPSQYWPETVVTFVEKSNGERIGEKYHSFYGSASGTDSYYDPSTWSKYKAGASILCGGTCAESGEGNCSVNALNARTGAVSKTNVTPKDWYGYDSCKYWDSEGSCSMVYGTVSASCSTIYGCYIDVEWHALCYEG